MEKEKNFIVPVEIMKDKNLSNGEKMLYSYILNYSQEGKFFTNNKSLSRNAGLNKDWVNSLLCRLKKRSLIDIERGKMITICGVKNEN